MRATVTPPFHHPVTGALLERGTVLEDKDLKPVLADPELANRVSVSDRKE